MQSALYRGWLEHRRREPKRHEFRYRLFMVYLDLGELDRVFRGRWLWSTTRRALARFDRRDHFGDPSVPLDESVRRLVADHTGARPAGPIRLLTHLRYFGHVFNPVSFYYCFDAAGTTVETVVAEVTNTPWGERHCYVLPRGSGNAGGALHARCAKALHVSPFHPMSLEYDWHFAAPAAALGVHMVLSPVTGGSPVFDATLALRRVPIGTGSLALALVQFPLMTVRVLAAIHWQALRLWLKRVPVIDHPAKQRSTSNPPLHQEPTQ